jgi:hypothetical protein
VAGGGGVHGRTVHVVLHGDQAVVVHGGRVEAVVVVVVQVVVGVAFQGGAAGVFLVAVTVQGGVSHAGGGADAEAQDHGNGREAAGSRDDRAGSEAGRRANRAALQGAADHLTGVAAAVHDFGGDGLRGGAGGDGRPAAEAGRLDVLLDQVLAAEVGNEGVGLGAAGEHEMSHGRHCVRAGNLGRERADKGRSGSRENSSTLAPPGEGVWYGAQASAAQAAATAAPRVNGTPRDAKASSRMPAMPRAS